MKCVGQKKHSYSQSPSISHPYMWRYDNIKAFNWFLKQNSFYLDNDKIWKCSFCNNVFHVVPYCWRWVRQTPTHFVQPNFNKYLFRFSFVSFRYEKPLKILWNHNKNQPHIIMRLVAPNIHRIDMTHSNL